MAQSRFGELRMLLISQFFACMGQDVGQDNQEVDTNDGFLAGSSLSKDAECDSPACLELGASIRMRVDETVAPCDDFYLFACGGENDRRQSSFDKSVLSRSIGESSDSSDTASKCYDIIGSLLDADAPVAPGPLAKHMQSAQRFQADCIRKASAPEASFKLNDSRLAILKEVVTFTLGPFGDWAPGDSWDVVDSKRFSTLLAELVKMEYMASLSPLAITDDLDTESPAKGRRVGICAAVSQMLLSDTIETAIATVSNIDLVDSGVILPAEFYAVDVFKGLVKELGEVIKHAIDSEEAKSSSNTNEEVTFMHLAELKTWWADKPGLGARLIDWEMLFRSLGRSTYDALAQGPTPPYVRILEVKPKCREQPADLSLDLMLDAFYYLGPNKTVTLLKINALANMINSASSAGLRSPMKGLPASYTPKEACARLVVTQFDWLVAAMFIRAADVLVDLDDKRDETKKVLEAIRSAFIANLADLDWLDRRTRNFAQRKAQEVGSKIFYPDWLLSDIEVAAFYDEVSQLGSLVNYEIQIMALVGWKAIRGLREVGVRPYSKIWSIPPNNFNAVYDPTVNDVEVMAAFVQPPAASSSALGASLFGKLGVMLGHEFTHGFDSVGHKYDDQGNQWDWWDPQTRKLFEEKTECFVEQVGEIGFAGHRLSTLLSRSGNDANDAQGDISIAQQTLRENIADNGGVGLAWLAYREWMETNGSDPFLKGLKYSPSQIFFLEFAGASCRAVTPVRLQEQLVTDSHLVNELRVNVALRNSLPFAAAFGCAKDSPMNPERKCRLWGAVPPSKVGPNLDASSARTKSCFNNVIQLCLIVAWRVLPSAIA